MTPTPCRCITFPDLQVQHPSVAQLVAVAAHSFTANDLLRVERILLDALEFNITSPTAYNFLHLLTQVCLHPRHLQSAPHGPRRPPCISVLQEIVPCPMPAMGWFVPSTSALSCCFTFVLQGSNSSMWQLPAGRLSSSILGPAGQ